LFPDILSGEKEKRLKHKDAHQNHSLTEGKGWSEFFLKHGNKIRTLVAQGLIQ
jgi:hypothetical protein